MSWGYDSCEIIVSIMLFVDELFYLYVNYYVSYVLFVSVIYKLILNSFWEESSMWEQNETWCGESVDLLRLGSTKIE